MRIKHALLIAGGFACAAGGFLLAQRLDRLRYEERAQVAQQSRESEAAALRAAASKWAAAVAMAEGESLLKAFVAGISPAVLAQRRESVELAAIGLLRVPGVAGIHVLGTSGEILYSSDAKLATTGEAEYRGAWALQATELVSRPSTRPGVIDFAVPIASGGTRLAVAWLEYDVALVRDAARPGALNVPSLPEAPPVAHPETPPGPAPEASLTATPGSDEASAAAETKTGEPVDPP